MLTASRYHLAWINRRPHCNYMAEHKKLIVNPLVLFNIADHYKRKLSALGRKPGMRVVGALYGVQDQTTIKATLGSPLRLAENEISGPIDNSMLEEALDITTELIKTDHPGNHLANLQLVGFYKATSSLEPTQEDKKLFELFGSRFENARLLIVNPEETVQSKSARVFVRSPAAGEDTGKMIPAPFDFSVEMSETICMQSVNTQGKEAPYLRTLTGLKSVSGNYQELLTKLRTQMPLIRQDIFKLRELNTLLNSLSYISEQGKILKSMDSSVVESLAACMFIDEHNRSTRGSYD